MPTDHSRFWWFRWFGVDSGCDFADFFDSGSILLAIFAISLICARSLWFLRFHWFGMDFNCDVIDFCDLGPILVMILLIFNDLGLILVVILLISVIWVRFWWWFVWFLCSGWLIFTTLGGFGLWFCYFCDLGSIGVVICLIPVIGVVMLLTWGKFRLCFCRCLCFGIDLGGRFGDFSGLA